MSDIERIKQEIERLKHNTPNAYDLSRFMLLEEIESFINSLPEEPASEDLEEEIQRAYYDKSLYDADNIDRTDFNCIARHFAEWQKQQDEELFKDDSWNYIEELYPNTSQEEKLRLYDISIKSRLAGANTIKQQMKETLQTEYEKGRFDMREEMMKTLVEGEIVKDIHNQLKVTSEPLNDTFGKFGDRVKIIIVKEEQK